ncbi:hypothetical protein ACFWDB_07105 [Micromonospora chalcea]|uniref:hypothetical protein n=1 Tax=Micromonospora sp. TSRI0369 TaxID=1703936 RepID=UPI00093D4DB7|nr:hypothetical protein [Micromonospora sp. TSRI0369]
MDTEEQQEQQTDRLSARQASPPDSTSSSTAAQARQTLTALANSMWQQARDRERDGWPPWWLPLFAVLVLAAVLGLLVVPLIRTLVEWGAAAAADLTGWAHGQAYARIVLDPVRDYLASHAAGLPVDGTTLWRTWCLAGGMLLLFSLVRSAGARIGWTLYGIGTAAMVAAETTGPGRWVAVGICALSWSLLSIPALSRHRRRPQVIVAPPSQPAASPAPTVPAPRRATSPQPAPAQEEHPDDDASWAAGLYEVLMRREHLAPPAPQRWSATTHGSNGFTAVCDDGRHAAGIAVSGEAVRELLAGLSTPPGARPQVAWTTAPPAAPRGRRMDYIDLAEVGGIHQFVLDSTDTLAQLAEVLRERRTQWPVARTQLGGKIRAQAAVLDRAHPLVRGASYTPDPTGGYDDPGTVTLNDWVPTNTIVGSNAAAWNDFAGHRPAQIALIIGKLLTADDPASALTEILTDDDHVHLTRYLGPAGPLHKVTVNGTHRTHALRLLGVPLVAAEVTVEPLPLRLDVFSASTTDGWGPGRHHGPTASLWRALIDRGLVTGRITDSGLHAILEPYQAAASWLLSSPRDAATISAAYDRIYPGALGIPAEAMSGPAQWCQWLLDDPWPTL